MARKNVDVLQSAAGQIGGLISEMLRIRDKIGITPEEFAVLFTPVGEPHLEKMIKGLKIKPIVEAVKKAVAVLAFVAVAVAPAVAIPMDPNEAFQDRLGLCVYSDFRTRVLPALKPISSAPEASFTVSSFTKNANDSMVRKELSKEHLAEWHHVISLIGQQPNGEDGVLLTNGYANIFYMCGVGGQVFAVDVYWYSARRQWDVNAWLLDEADGWDAGGQVFSCNSQAV